MKRTLLIMVVSMIVSIMHAEIATIKDIKENPSKYKGEVVTIKGLVTRWVPGKENTTSHYLVEGDYGFTIQINTAQVSPETNYKYEITGIVYIEPDTGEPFISEQGRTNLTLPAAATVPDEKSGGNTLMIILIVGVIIIIALILVLLFRKPGGSKAKGEPADIDEDFQTIKLSAAGDPKTLKFIPGELKIISGTDEGKVFKIAGYPTPEGNIVTIGREDIKGERGYAHIRLMEKTISRKQAELIESNNTLKVKNISKTNLTIVDGVQLQPDEEVEIKPNSTIKTGEVEFQYIL
ncbi:FHA domain-containing protein [Saccharicrinis sp. FJH54]